MENQFVKKRVRDASEDSEHDSPEVKRLRDDLLGFLDDSDADQTTQDLDSVMKSLEEEISATTSCSASPASAPVPVVDLTSDTGESQPELGYLLEASDDELGLPPSINSSDEECKKDETELVGVSTDSSVIGELWGFDDHIPSYDSFGLGVGDNYNSNNDYVAFDGLFGYSDVYFDSSDFAEISWRSETLPAL
ncbi:uncharacterized protein LOC107429425 [Ziziphus jujuba]|uniref:Uncharacterized protein LOC107429425 n=2 Tax=Ziziphus jujuba TaxID=326968 RepID=A0A6P4AII0_ZIZJJ|nr:uncharacterized protein LOC107429425 [Ziziphus jujuba]KAH7516544.1 hypothetical protein FEM48_Zijuj10G0146300 [Ziziphus jujuba var. spinosa]